MTIIAPSLLSCDFLNIESELHAFKNSKNIWFHLDVMDGHFVPQMTFGHPLIKLLGEKSNHPLDAHLMVDNPSFYIETLKNYNVHNLTFHYETVKHHDRIIHSIKEKYPSVGMAINPGTSLDVIPDSILCLLDLVLIMSVNPGFGGQKFIPYIREKISQLAQRKKSTGAHFMIQVDGGIDASLGAELIKLGANNLVAGSYIFGHSSTEYLSRVESLRTP